ncbi:hypothetical protein PGT21_001016 [Puccinia graminis f. sp. tritici]|uniref:Secreted protein n=1 Tax=Puccinia graminis f. sp. tritici TaxID=56615 RepID=A0A5B0P6P9_PUCGR|nr:hypothetical protein PGT21_001016 [Puccinia graminis f. sp. tritici]
MDRRLLLIIYLLRGSSCSSTTLAACEDDTDLLISLTRARHLMDRWLLFIFAVDLRFHHNDRFPW